MSRQLRRMAGSLSVPTVVFLVTLWVLPGHRELIVHVFVLVVVGIGLLWFVAGVYAATAPTGPSAFEDALTRRATEPDRFSELDQLEREVQLGAVSAFDLHYRLVPVLREIARGLLATRRGIDLDRRPALARELLGDEAWELIRPDRDVPEDRLAPGPGLAPIARTVGRLEAL